MSHTLKIPRLMIAGGNSGAGKTTMMIMLTAAFQRLGMKVACFKCGPDYLDPTYHKRQTGSCQNLDGWMMGREAVIRTFTETAADADIALIEGVMGLYDSAGPRTATGSSAEIAQWLEAPVLITLDASGIARTIDALAAGLAHYDRQIHVAGLLLNRLGSEGHLKLLKEASQTVAVVGGLPKKTSFKLPERHLGLVAAHDPNILDSLHAELDDVVSHWFDMETILEIARQAPDLVHLDFASDSTSLQYPNCKIAYALDDCFHFYYEDNLRRLRSLGVTLIPFSPLTDKAVPDCNGIYFGGGYPELYAEHLSNNQSMLDSIRRHAKKNKPIYGECGGLMYLSQSIELLDDRRFPMLGLLPLHIRMQDKLQALGYTEVEIQQPSIIGRPGLRFRGHQFRYSEARLEHDDIQTVYRLKSRRHQSQTEGYQVGNTLASYVHAHWASNPLVCQAFVTACQAENL